MKQILSVLLFAAVLTSSCSKSSKQDDQPTNANTVTIGGTDYTTASIGTQTWTTVNYNGSGGVNYNGSSTNVPTYGKLYTLAEAKAISLPSGWRLPTKADAEKLLLYLGAKTEDSSTPDAQDGIAVQGDASVAKKMKSKTDWTYTNGDNSSGFNAYPQGATTDIKTYSGKGQLANFWTGTANGVNNNFIFGVYNTKEDNNTINDFTGMDYTPYANTTMLAIRFVKDN
jgi:uncharacterized protein (TIGR02145 family)